MENWKDELKKDPNYLGEVTFRDFKCFVMKDKYKTADRNAMILKDQEDGSMVAVASVNVSGTDLADDEILIKDYSENEGMLDALVGAGYVMDTGKKVRSGFVEIPICKLLKDGNPDTGTES